MTERSFLFLRRLAGRAHRSAEARAVLHDVLLENFPGYVEAVEDADRRAASMEPATGDWSVWFFPSWLNPTTRRFRMTHLAFQTHGANVTKADFARSRYVEPDSLRRGLVVYTTNCWSRPR